MNEMVGHMVGGEPVVFGTALADFLTLVFFALVIVLVAKYVIPYARK